jgi:cytochrome P450
MDNVADLAQKLFTPEGLENPYPIYRAFRESAPVVWVPFHQGEGGRFVITSYPYGDAVLKDARVFKDGSKLGWVDENPINRSMLFQDPPSHTRLRGLVNRAFTPAMVARLGPRIQEIVEELADDLAGLSSVDFMTALAQPLPVIVIAEILGVPSEDRPRFREWSRLTVGDGDTTPEESTAAGVAMAQYFDHLIRDKRRNPSDDLISALLHLEDAGDRLSHEELLGMCVLLLVAGHETTINLLGNGLYAILRHREQWDRLHDEPELVDTAVEEMLRYDAPVQEATFRFAGERLELAGVAIESGTMVNVMLGAANRDPDQFPEPDRFDVGRTPNRHLSFGRGIHVCLGAPVARLEAQLAFTHLVNRFPRLDVADTPTWRPNAMFRGLQHLLVTTGA